MSSDLGARVGLKPATHLLTVMVVDETGSGFSGFLELDANWPDGAPRNLHEAQDKSTLVTAVLRRDGTIGLGKRAVITGWSRYAA